MASSTGSNARIDIVISLDPQTHSFTSTEPPKLVLKVTSRADTPITLYTWRTPLSLPQALTTNGIKIVDTATNEPVQTASLMVNRSALKRTRGTPDEKYFVTLHPQETLELSCGFGRAGGGVKPQPKSIVEKGWEVDDEGNPRKIRRSQFATGVDGLEPGHRYTVGLDVEALGKMWWAPVDREEVLVDGNAEGSYVQDYVWEKTPLEFQISEGTLEVEGA
ncbi:hypothetical protein EJ04DRAFT_148180 [Polyplosphaeria fusca]|uniref:Uncharacterized protein n=1 Tax=Polyplosphaeria fusca TaxID=682080 RepID=A0A9P4USU8_9PLEO|nr:hypothetical protein EJ04DRAFT_148180 [Polyplosphaeria fusca]